MRLFSPSSLWFLVLVPILILMYILKQKFEEKEVSSLFLWHQVLADAEASTPFQKLRSNLLFFLQMLALLICIFALANPFVWWKNKGYQNFVLVMDTTGSMSGFGEKNIKLEEAKGKAEELVNAFPSGSKITLISASKNPKVEIAGSSDKKEVIKKIKALDKTNSEGDVNEVYSLVKAICSQYESYKVSYLTDRPVDFGELNSELIYFISKQDNISLDYISHSNTGNSLKVMIRTTNRGKKEAPAEVCLYGEDKLFSIKNVELMPGETKTVYFDNMPLNYNYLMGEITQQDSLMEDNTIYSVVKQNSSSKVLLSTEKNVFLEKVLAAIKDVDIYKTIPGESLEGDFDLYIFDGNIPLTLPVKGNILLINADKSTSLFEQEDEIQGGKVEILDHIVTRYMKNSDFYIAKIKAIKVPYFGNSLLKVNDKDISFAGENRGQKIGVLGFDIHNSDLPLTPEFPIFINSLISYLIERDITGSTEYFCGESIEVAALPETERIVVSNPKKSKTVLNIKENSKSYTSTFLTGIYEITQSIGKEDINKLTAVNFPTSESSLNVHDINLSNSNSTEISRGGVNLRNLLLIIALIIIILEWIFYLRLHGSRQIKGKKKEGRLWG